MLKIAFYISFLYLVTILKIMKMNQDLCKIPNKVCFKNNTSCFNESIKCRNEYFTCGLKYCAKNKNSCRLFLQSRASRKNNSIHSTNNTLFKNIQICFYLKNASRANGNYKINKASLKNISAVKFNIQIHLILYYLFLSLLNYNLY